MDTYVDKVMGVLFSMIAFFFFVLMSAAVFSAYKELTGEVCTEKGQIMKLETTYSMTIGCMAKVQDQWIPMKNVGFVMVGDKMNVVPFIGAK